MTEIHSKITFQDAVKMHWVNEIYNIGNTAGIELFARMQNNTYEQHNCIMQMATWIRANFKEKDPRIIAPLEIDDSCTRLLQQHFTYVAFLSNCHDSDTHTWSFHRPGMMTRRKLNAYMVVEQFTKHMYERLVSSNIMPLTED